MKLGPQAARNKSRVDLHEQKKKWTRQKKPRVLGERNQSKTERPAAVDTKETGLVMGKTSATSATEPTVEGNARRQTVTDRVKSKRIPEGTGEEKGSPAKRAHGSVVQELVLVPPGKGKNSGCVG